jgi:putative endonuclease
MIPVSASGSFHYVYILKSKKTGDWYTGCTSDLRKRFKQHNSGEENSWTKGRRPFELIYYEAYKHSKDAYNREKQMKSGPGKRYMRERLKRFLALTG